MSEAEIARNAAALRNLAARLERMGYTGGDAHTEAEHIAVNLLADGYRPIDKPPPLRGPGASRQAREAAIEAARIAVQVVKEARKKPAEETA
jgi:hypothetical protein